MSDTTAIDDPAAPDAGVPGEPPPPAPEGGEPRGTEPPLRRPGGVVAPTREDPVARAASPVAGGPAGSRLASVRGFWWAAPVLIMLSVAFLGLGVVQKQHCRAEGWGAPGAYWRACYSDIPALLGGADMPSGLRDAAAATGQPPLVGTVVWGLSAGVDRESPDAARAFFDLSVFFLALCLMLAIWAVALAARRRSWDAAHVALSPILVVVAYLNYDLMAVALAAGALLAWSRSRWVLAGVALGLAAAGRSPYLVLLVALGVLALRSGRWREPVGTTLITLVTWLGLRVLLVPGATAGLEQAWNTWRGAGPGYGSLWLVPGLVAESKPQGASWWFRAEGLSPGATTTAALIGLGLVILLVVTITLTAPRRPRLAHLALVLVVGVLLVSKALPPQASLLVLPLIALAGLRWKNHLLWAVPELIYFVAVWMYIGRSEDPAKGLPPAFYLVFLLLRLGALAYLGWLAIRAIRDPGVDPVRTPLEGPAADDPQGGPFDGRPDALVARAA